VEARRVVVRRHRSMRALGLRALGAFLPLVHQAARVLARGTARRAASGDTWSAPASAEWRIEDEAGRDIPVNVETSGGRHARGERAARAHGALSRVRGSAAARELRREPRPREGDSRRARRSLIAAFPAPRAAAARGRRSRRARARGALRRELWPEFVLLALLLSSPSR
jgi:hypothetical protein